MTYLISGGAKNGKSSLAQNLAVSLAAGGTHYYVATMIPVDEEDRARIRRHIADRAGLGFETLECGKHLLSCLETVDTSATFLLDSVTALLANEMFDPAGFDPDAAERVAEELAQFVSRTKNVVFVSDYLYSDAQIFDEWTEKYRRGLALVDRSLAKCCETVLEVSSGMVICHKGVLPL